MPGTVKTDGAKPEHVGCINRPEKPHAAHMLHPAVRYDFTLLE